jgi:hypothetical protein
MTKEYCTAINQLVDVLARLPFPEMEKHLYKLEDNIWDSIERRYPQPGIHQGDVSQRNQITSQIKEQRT